MCKISQSDTSFWCFSFSLYYTFSWVLTEVQKLLERAVQVKDQASETGVRRLQIRCSLKICKFHRKTSVLESLFNQAAGLQVCSSLKKRLQHRCFPVRPAKFLKIPFFTEGFQWLLLTFNLCFQRCSKQKPLWHSAVNIRVSWKKYLLPRKSRSSHRRCSGLQQPAKVFSCEYCEIFKNTYFEKNLWTAAYENQVFSDKFPDGKQFLNFIILLKL